MSDAPCRQEIEILDHTADMGFFVRAESLPRLFERAGLALSLIVWDIESVDNRAQTEVEVEGWDLEGLMYNWLSEILYQFDGEKKVFSSFSIEELSPASTPLRLRARLGGESYDSDKHCLKTYVKAVTFHQMQIETDQPNCSARVFIDI